MAIQIECGTALTIETERGDEFLLHPVFLGSALKGYKPEGGCGIVLSQAVQRSSEPYSRLEKRINEVARECEKQGVTVNGLGFASEDAPNLVPTFEQLERVLRKFREGWAGPKNGIFRGHP